MQEGIGLAALDRVVARQRRLDIGQRVLIFGMFGDPVDGDGFDGAEDFFGVMLAVGFAEEAPHVIGGRIEHGS